MKERRQRERGGRRGEKIIHINVYIYIYIQRERGDYISNIHRFDKLGLEGNEMM